MQTGFNVHAVSFSIIRNDLIYPGSQGPVFAVEIFAVGSKKAKVESQSKIVPGDKGIGNFLPWGGPSLGV